MRTSLFIFLVYSNIVLFSQINNTIKVGEQLYKKGEYAEALNVFEKILDYNDSIIVQKALFNISKIYIDIENSKLAYKYLQKSLVLALDINDTNKIAFCYNNFGSYYAIINKTDSSIYFYNKALKLFKIAKNKQGIAGANNNLAKTYFINQDYENAIDYYKNSYLIAKKLNIPEDITLYLLNIGATNLKLNNKRQALISFKEAFLIADSIGLNLNKLRAAKELYFFYKNEEDYENALYYFEIVNKTDKKLFGIKLQEEISNLQNEIEIQEKNNRIKLLTKEKVLSEIKVKNRNYYILILLISILLFVILAIYIFKQKTFKQQILKEKLEKEKVLAELNEKKLELVKEKSDSKSRELSSLSIMQERKNELLKNIYESVNLFEKQKDSSLLNDLKIEIKNNISIESDWEVFKLHFEEVHPSFFEKLAAEYPELTQNNLKLCAYIKIGLSNKEISRLLNISPDSVKTSKKRLKRKLNVKPGSEFSF